MKRVGTTAVMAAALGVVLAVGGCQDSQPPAPVIVNNTPADSGMAVLLTVALGGAFLAVVAAGVFAWCWANERRARRDAEGLLFEVTGASPARVRAAVMGLRPTTSGFGPATSRPGPVVALDQLRGDDPHAGTDGSAR